MKINFCDNISFQKTLVAKGAVLKNNRTKNCRIYQLDSDERLDYYYSKIRGVKDWRDQLFALYAFCDEDNDEKALYVIENNRKCLGYVEVSDDYPNVKQVNYLEVREDIMSRVPGRKIKYTGQTLMAFIAAISERENRDKLNVPYPANSAVGFYKNACILKSLQGRINLFLDRDNFEHLVSYNEQKTGKRIKLIG